VLGSAVVQAVLDDWRTAPVDARLRATLGFLARLNAEPEAIGPADVAALRAAGVERAAIRDAIYVCACFNVIDRVADALAFAVATPAEFARGARVLLRFGYRVL
jgi:alkylhydroperoxidase family enzyme